MCLAPGPLKIAQPRKLSGLGKKAGGEYNPNGVAARWRKRDSTPLLGCLTQSLWDCSPAPNFRRAFSLAAKNVQRPSRTIARSSASRTMIRSIKIQGLASADSISAPRAAWPKGIWAMMVVPVPGADSISKLAFGQFQCDKCSLVNPGQRQRLQPGGDRLASQSQAPSRTAGSRVVPVSGVFATPPQIVVTTRLIFVSCRHAGFSGTLGDACSLDSEPPIRREYQTIVSICIWGEHPIAPARTSSSFPLPIETRPP